MLEQIIEHVRVAGDLALKMRFSGLKHWIKGDSSPLSEADLAVNDYLHANLRPLMPQAAWLSEETTDNEERLSAEYLWVIDPIDGTRAFVKGDDDWCVSVALLRDNLPFVGVLYRPSRNLLFTSSRGEGAFLNGEKLSMRDKTMVSALKITGPQPLINQFVRQGLIDSPKIHSLALRIASVTTDEIDVAIASQNAHDWDIAAAALIVSEAGGILQALDGTQLAFNGVSLKHSPLIVGSRHNLSMISL